MLRRRKNRPAVGVAGGFWGGLAGVMLFLTAACEERDRLTFPSPSDGVGPVTIIDQPNGFDTIVPSGPGFFVYGRTIDPDGVDTVYFLVTGANYSPFHPSPVVDTVRFGLPITTFGLSGDTLLVQVQGVDTHGNQGTRSHRQIVVQ